MLLEHYVTLSNEQDQKKKYYDEVMNILSSSYAKIGGAQSTSLNKLMDSNILWKLATRNGKVVAVLISKLVQGTRKTIMGGTDGTPQGKRDLYAITKEEVEQLNRHSWAEVSGAMEYIYVDKSGATLIPDDLSQELMRLLGKTIHPTGDGYHYTREIGPNKENHEKVIVGNEEQLRALVNILNSDPGTRMIENIDSRQIRLAKKILESAGYKVKKVF